VKKFDPWAEQDAYDEAIEKGAVYTCPRTGWKFRVRYFAAWSPYPRKASAIVWSRPENTEIGRKMAAGEPMTKDEEAQHERAMLETAIRSTVMGWQGVTDRNGKKLEPNIDNMMLVFGKLKPLWSAIGDFAAAPANFGLAGPQSATRVPDSVSAEGNSEDTSDTSSEDSTD